MFLRLILASIFALSSASRLAQAMEPIPIQQGPNGLGHLLIPGQGQRFISPLLCGVTISGGDLRKLRVFNDFKKAGGEGKIFQLTTELDSHRGREEYGFYLEISRVPDQPSPNSSILWLRDPVTLKAVQKWSKEGPLFIRPLSQVNYKAAVVCGGNALMDGLLIHNLDARYEKYPGAILTEITDEYILTHERRHYDDRLGKDGFKTSSFMDELNKFFQQTELMTAGFDFMVDPHPILSFVVEQRADVARLKKARADLSTRRTIAIRKKGTRTGVEEQPFAEYYRELLDDCLSQRLNQAAFYGKPTYEMLLRLQAFSPDQAHKLYELIARSVLPDRDIGLDQLLPRF
jgi:hypothetical protein